MHVIVLEDSTGFPAGSATAARILNLGRMLTEGGSGVTLLLTRPSESTASDRNTSSEGMIAGIHYSYTCGTQVKASNFFGRRWQALRGACVALVRIRALARLHARETVLYLYTDTPSLSLAATAVARALSVPVVTELCEWKPTMPSCSWAQLLYYKFARLQTSDAIVAISTRLREKAAERSKAAICRIPILTDVVEYLGPRSLVDRNLICWCGQVDSYFEDIAWLIQAFRFVLMRFPSARLAIVGECRAKDAAMVQRLLSAENVPAQAVQLLGYVDRPTLLELYSKSAALLLPLPESERSRCRFPTKLGEYLASGRPVITTAVGDLTRYLQDGATAFIAAPGDPVLFAEKIAAALKNPGRADTVGAAGREVARRHFHYAQHGPKLVKFLSRQLHSPTPADSTSHL